MKNSFIVYHDILPLLEALGDADKGKLFEAMVRYSATGEVVELPKSLQLAFITVKTTIDRNAKNYEVTCQRNRDNAFKRWQKIPKHASASDGMRVDAIDADSDSDSDSDITPKNHQAILKAPETITKLSSQFHLKEGVVEEFAAAYLDWCSANGKRPRDYVAGLRNWIRTDAKMYGKKSPAQAAPEEVVYE